MSWARLLKRVFEIDLELCPNCGGELKIIAAILEAPASERILTHLGLQAKPRAGKRAFEFPLRQKNLWASLGSGSLPSTWYRESSATRKVR
jgi:hypothetical protein